MIRNFSFVLILGILFTAIGTASLFLTKEQLTPAIWLSFGNGLILSSLRFNSVTAQGVRVSRPVPKIRLYAGIFLIVLAVVLLGVQVYQDMQLISQAK